TSSSCPTPAAPLSSPWFQPSSPSCCTPAWCASPATPPRSSRSSRRLRGHPDPRFHLHPDRPGRVERTDRHPGTDACHCRQRHRPPAHQHPRSPAALAAKEDVMPRSTAKTDARTRLLDAALSVIRARGYSATSVDELCAAAVFTKGAFFHHFKSKD